MNDAGMGAGLGAVGFWLFLAAVVVGGIWYAVRTREAQQETLRRAIESGKALDEGAMGKLLAVDGGADRLDRSLRVAGLIMLAIAPGLVILGIALAFLDAQIIYPLLGVAGLVLCLALGLLFAARLTRRDIEGDTRPPLG